MADESDGEVLSREEVVGSEGGLFFGFVEALGLLKEVDPDVFCVVGHVCG